MEHITVNGVRYTVRDGITAGIMHALKPFESTAESVNTTPEPEPEPGKKKKTGREKKDRR